MLQRQFWKKYKEKGVDYDHLYGEQCVDLANAYAREVCNIHDAFTGFQYAYEVFTQYPFSGKLKQHFHRVRNSKSNYPAKGDFVVWGKERNGYAGHIAVVVKATPNTITVLEQNFDGKGKTRSPKRADGGIRKYTYKNYNHVLGWLTPYRTVSTSGGELRIRSTPKKDSPVIGHIPNGCRFALLGTTQGEYKYQCRFAGVTGYCHSKYVK